MSFNLQYELTAHRLTIRNQDCRRGIFKEDGSMCRLDLLTQQLTGFHFPLRKKSISDTKDAEMSNFLDIISIMMSHFPLHYLSDNTRVRDKLFYNYIRPNAAISSVWGQKWLMMPR